MDNQEIFDFWKRVDLKRNVSLNELSKQVGLKLGSLLDLRSDCRLPKTEVFFNISKKLNVSMEYLLTGEDKFQDILPPRIKAVVDCLSQDEDRLEAVETLLFGKKEVAGVPRQKDIS